MANRVLEELVGKKFRHRVHLNVRASPAFVYSGEPPKDKHSAT